jgi:hypothetical protein
MARSKSKHMRTIMQRRKKWKQQVKRNKAAVKANGGKPLPRKAAHVKKNPPLPPPPRAPESGAQAAPAAASTPAAS